MVIVIDMEVQQIVLGNDEKPNLNDLTIVQRHTVGTYLKYMAQKKGAVLANNPFLSWTISVF